MTIADTVAACESLILRHAPRLMRTHEAVDVINESRPPKKHKGNRVVPLSEQLEIVTAYAGPATVHEIADLHGLQAGTIYNIACRHKAKKGKQQ